MKTKRIRAYSFNKPIEKVNICKHLVVVGKETEDVFPACEYVENIKIYCPVCKRWKNFEVAIN